MKTIVRTKKDLDFRTKVIIRLIIVLGILINPVFVMAQETCSTTYCANEYYFGTGGEIDAQSGSYRARQSTGELGIGNSSSASYGATAGFNTPSEEYLEFYVNTTDVNLGVLTTASAQTGTATFSVRNYLSSGYAVLSYGTPLTMGSYTLTNLTSPTTSSPGTEQFGINLVDNSSPDVGDDPEQIPDASFSFGEASSGYDTLNNFKYVSGDAIAESPQATGQTNYTISYLANINNLTPGGVYTMTHILIVVPTF